MGVSWREQKDRKTEPYPSGKARANRNSEASEARSQAIKREQSRQAIHRAKEAALQMRLFK